MTDVYSRGNHRKICRRECAGLSGQVHVSAANFVSEVGGRGGQRDTPAGAKRPRLLRGESRPRSGRSDRKSFGLLQRGIAEAVHQSVNGLAGFAHGAVPGLVALVVGQVVGVKDGVEIGRASCRERV